MNKKELQLRAWTGDRFIYFLSTQRLFNYYVKQMKYEVTRKTYLKDKHSVDIWEKDIINWYSFSKKENRIIVYENYEVLYNEENDSFYVDTGYRPEKKMNKEWLFKDRMRLFTNIGNIYQNKNLLKICQK